MKAINIPDIPARQLVLLLFVFSLFVAAAIRPFVTTLVKRGVPPGVAQLLLYGIGLGSIMLVLLW